MEWENKKCFKCCKNKVFVDIKHLERKNYLCKDCLGEELINIFWEQLTKTLPLEFRTEVVVEHIRSCGIYYDSHPKEKEVLIKRMGINI